MVTMQSVKRPCRILDRRGAWQMHSGRGRSSGVHGQHCEFCALPCGCVLWLEGKGTDTNANVPRLSWPTPPFLLHRMERLVHCSEHCGSMMPQLLTCRVAKGLFRSTIASLLPRAAWVRGTHRAWRGQPAPWRPNASAGKHDRHTACAREREREREREERAKQTKNGSGGVG